MAQATPITFIEAVNVSYNPLRPPFETGTATELPSDELSIEYPASIAFCATMELLMPESKSRFNLIYS
jgi:hypothetical protein